MKKVLSFLLPSIYVLVGLLSIPVLTFAARTAAPVLTGLFPSSTLSVNLPTPTNFSLGTATTTGTVYSNNGAAMYFEVTALDGVGESSASNLLGTTTVNQAHGYQITWTPVQGASAYRVYFSTSTPQSVTQYFTATTTSYYTFTSTSSPTYVANNPSGNTAYVVNLASNGNSWINGGLLAIATTTPSVGQVTIASSTGPQLSLTDTGGVAAWNFRSIGTSLYIATSSGTATGTLSAFTITPTGKIGIASSTFSGLLGLGTTGSTNGTSTIVAGKWQIDGANSAGTRECTYLVGTTLTVTAGACNQ